MDLQRLLGLLLFVLLGLSVATPVTTDRLGRRSLSTDQGKREKQLQSLHETWSGIYFNYAAEECSEYEFDILVDTLEGAKKLTTQTTYPIEKSPGWNRFFLADSNVLPGNGWAVSYTHNSLDAF